MGTAETVLIIILASVLTILLLLWIVLTVLLLKLVKSIKHVVAKAEGIVDSVESVGEVFKNAKGPLAVFKLIQNIVEFSKKHHK